MSVLKSLGLKFLFTVLLWENENIKVIGRDHTDTSQYEQDRWFTDELENKKSSKQTCWPNVKAN